MGTGILVLLAFAAGVVTGFAAFQYAFKLAARYQRAGHIETPAKPEERSSMPADPEGAAHRRVMDDAVKRGADDLMLMAEAAGERITREEAENDAREIIRATHGATSLGGTN